MTSPENFRLAGSLLDFQLIKMHLCKNLGVKKTSALGRKMPLASSEASATPCFKKLSGALKFLVKVYLSEYISLT